MGSDLWVGPSANKHLNFNALLTCLYKVRSQTKKTILFGNFSQTSDPPHPTPPFENPCSKKNLGVILQKNIVCFLGDSRVM